MKSTHPRIFFIDLDGTLLDYHGHFSLQKPDLTAQISLKNRTAIATVQKKCPVIISTGRHSKFVLPLIQKLNLPYAITQNGAEIIDQSGKIIKSEKMEPSTALQIIAFAQTRKMAIKLNADHHIYGCNWLIRRFVKVWGWKAHRRYEPLLAQVAQMQEVNKLVLLGKTKATIKRYLKQLKHLNYDVIGVTSSRGYTIEITDQKATKGLAAVFVAQKLGYEAQEAMHIGDTMNDSTTVGVLGTVVAMKNAAKQFKKIATHLGPNYKNGGVAAVLIDQAYRKNKKASSN